ncbi:hypothetical protein CBR_g53679 [Chara braunii]|uniref:Methenyltetrahydrofolate synthase domain-containing protein n=1 Tax=Chara braunii TaxID=69332 RepID=A0A388MB61_CHABU|nr:hypothetical protein CBR_g53679 [Chara braunii]|eukprot:GBG91790.1 hypothetical protein CBR_g53679 [Chara braunii]
MAACSWAPVGKASTVDWRGEFCETASPAELPTPGRGCAAGGGSFHVANARARAIGGTGRGPGPSGVVIGGASRVLPNVKQGACACRLLPHDRCFQSSNLVRHLCSNLPRRWEESGSRSRRAVVEHLAAADSVVANGLSEDSRLLFRRGRRGTDGRETLGSNLWWSTVNRSRITINGWKSSICWQRDRFSQSLSSSSCRSSSARSGRRRGSLRTALAMGDASEAANVQSTSNVSVSGGEEGGGEGGAQGEGGGRGGGDGLAFDTEVYDRERLRLDAEAMAGMKEKAEAMERGGEGEEAEGSGGWKWKIRKRIWDLMEKENIAAEPRPVHHRIPNFVGANEAARMLSTLPEFKTAKCVKVNPDTPQKPVRYLSLSGGKVLITPQPRLRTGFFSSLDPAKLPAAALREACTSAGAAKYGVQLGLDAKIKVDLIVIGSVAVDPSTGARLGKGEGFAELEYGMLRWMGAIDENTLVVTSVHDKQLVDDIPTEKLLVHDVPVDVICTPTRIIFTETKIPKPTGIYWDKLSPEKLGQIRILQELKRRIEEETGEKLPSGPSEKLPPTAQRSRGGGGGATNPNPRYENGPVARDGRRGGENGGLSGRMPHTAFVWNLDFRTSKRALADHLMTSGVPFSRVDILRTNGQSRGMAKVDLRSKEDMDKLIEKMDRTVLSDRVIRLKVDEPRPTNKR